MANILRVKGCTRTIGMSQGFLGLPLRDEMTFDTGTKKEYPSMVTAWELMPQEIMLLSNGVPLMLRVIGTRHPPVVVYVGDEYKEPLMIPEREATGNMCPVCGNLTYRTRSGITCDNGHGGVT